MRKIPKVAAVHDMSGLGRCSLTVILPVLSVMGAQCCPLQTAYLSAHTAFPPSREAVFLDMTGQMAGVSRHWAELGTRFDAIYSGFLGSAEQLGLLQGFLDVFRGRETIVLVDPVLGDHGKLYRTCDAEMCRRMGVLAEGADLITPNLTEAAILLGERYQDAPRTEGAARQWLERLSLAGRRSVVITGVHFHTGEVGAVCFDRERGRIDLAMDQEIPGQFSGTGDLFAAVTLGALLRGTPLADAMGLAVRFVARCVRDTVEEGTPLLDGVGFEPLLGALL